jgi:hypothetical protein
MTSAEYETYHSAVLVKAWVPGTPQSVDAISVASRVKHSASSEATQALTLAQQPWQGELKASSAV